MPASLLSWLAILVVEIAVPFSQHLLGGLEGEGQELSRNGGLLRELAGARKAAAPLPQSCQLSRATMAYRTPVLFSERAPHSDKVAMEARC